MEWVCSDSASTASRQKFRRKKRLWLYVEKWTIRSRPWWKQVAQANNPAEEQWYILKHMVLTQDPARCDMIGRIQIPSRVKRQANIWLVYTFQRCQIGWEKNLLPENNNDQIHTQHTQSFQKVPSQRYLQGERKTSTEGPPDGHSSPSSRQKRCHWHQAATQSRFTAEDAKSLGLLGR